MLGNPYRTCLVTHSGFCGGDFFLDKIMTNIECCEKCGTSERYKSGACKECARRYYQQNKEKWEERRQKNRKKVNRYKSEWRKKNKSKVKEYNKKYLQEKAKENKKKYGITKTPRQKEQDRICQNTRRAHKNGAIGSFTIEEWRKLCDEYQNNCACCKQYKPLTIDHVIPISMGGSCYIDNIQPLCRSCNSKKGEVAIRYLKPKRKAQDTRWIISFMVQI